MSSPKLTFYNGQQIPALGLGTWKSEPGQVKTAVEEAIDIGYRHFDCAYVYGNEKEVGEALKNKIDSEVVKREDLFITSKLWNTFHRSDLVESACKASLDNLGLEYLDLYLMHWPTGYKEGDELFPSEDGKRLFSDSDYVDTWKAMEELVASGLVKSIGVSNFNSAQITRLLENTKIKPVTNQVECHAYLNQKKLSKFCHDRGILLTAYSPLGTPDRPWAKPTDPLLLDEPTLASVGKRHKRSPAQILIKYQLERGHIVIPKSVTPQRIKDNFNVFNFHLTRDDMENLDALNCNKRFLAVSSDMEHKDHPFKDIEF